jgi:hypothetical protein
MEDCYLLQELNKIHKVVTCDSLPGKSGLVPATLISSSLIVTFVCQNSLCDALEDPNTFQILDECDVTTTNQNSKFL